MKSTVPEHRQVERFLRELRDSHEHMVGVFTSGSCYHLYLVLRVFWPDAEPHYIDGHVYTEIGGRHYDITGRVRLTAAQLGKAEPDFQRIRKPLHWRGPNKRAAERMHGFLPWDSYAVWPDKLGAVRIFLMRMRVRLRRRLWPYKARRMVRLEVYRALVKPDLEGGKYDGVIVETEALRRAGVRI